MRRAQSPAVLGVGVSARAGLARAGDRVEFDGARDVHEALVALALDGARTVVVDADALGPRPRAALAALVEAAAPHEVVVLGGPDGRLPPALRAALAREGARSVASVDALLAPDTAARDEGDPEATSRRAEDRAASAPRRARRGPDGSTADRAALDEVGFADGCFRRLDRPDALCRFVLSRLGRALRARRTSLMLVDDAKTGLFVKAARGMDPSLVGRVRVALAGGLAGRAASLGRMTAGRAAVGGPRAYEGSAYVLLPLGRAGRCEGIVSLTDLPDDALPSDPVLRALRRMGDRAGRALSAARRLEQAEVLSTTDELTGLPNRRSFERALRRELERSRRTGTPLAVALLDVDHFKAMNDRFGHTNGDTVLVQVARRIAGAFRETDLVCRWGGEEFAVLLPELGEGDVAEALAAVERARVAVSARPLTLGPGLPSPIVSVSGGVAVRPAHGTEAIELLRRADEALYAAKRAGRDRVLAAS